MRRDPPPAAAKHPAFVLLLVLLALFLISSALFRHEIVSGNVWAMGVALGGMPKEEAEALIRQRAREVESGLVVISSGDKSVELQAATLGLNLDEAGLIRSLGGYVAVRPRLLPSLLSRLGSPRVMASPVASFAPEIEETAREIADWLSFLPVEERYAFDGRDLVVLPSEPGQFVSAGDVARALREMDGTYVTVPNTLVPAPQGTSLPSLGLMGHFDTEYDKSEEARNVNLALAAEACHLVFLEPGEVFSFNAAAGERTEAKGYREAMVVEGNRLVPGLAGGICQVTTTLFDAALLAGLDFPYVSAHGIPVDYVLPGWDAAVAWPYMDLKIKNSTDGPVVFGVWAEDGLVSARVFGVPSGKTYDVETVTVAEYAPPEDGMNPGLTVETYRVEKSGGVEIGRTRIMRNTYNPSYPRPEHP